MVKTHINVFFLSLCITSRGNTILSSTGQHNMEQNVLDSVGVHGKMRELLQTKNPNKNKEFSLRLKELRKEKNLTIDQLAEELQFEDSSIITKWERGKVFPTEKNLKKLADYFSVSYGYLNCQTVIRNGGYIEKDIEWFNIRNFVHIITFFGYSIEYIVVKVDDLTDTEQIVSSDALEIISTRYPLGKWLEYHFHGFYEDVSFVDYVALEDRYAMESEVFINRVRVTKNGDVSFYSYAEFIHRIRKAISNLDNNLVSITENNSKDDEPIMERFKKSFREYAGVQ